MRRKGEMRGLGFEMVRTRGERKTRGGFEEEGSLLRFIRHRPLLGGRRRATRPESRVTSYDDMLPRSLTLPLKSAERVRRTCGPED